MMAMMAAFPALVLWQSDCTRAYIQAIMTGPETLISLPKPWWPAHWRKYKHPVTELLLALYGHPKGGDIWGGKLHEICIAFGFILCAFWPGVYIRGAGAAALLIIAVYVDDLLFLGGEGLMILIGGLRRQIDMEDPKPIHKYLGCIHSVKVTGVEPNRITQISYDMSSYFIAACEHYTKRTGLKLKKVDTPYAPAIEKAK